MTNIPVVKLNNGVEMPGIGLGTYSNKPEELMNVIKEAINVGYRHFDTAWLYQTEKYVGKAIQEQITINGMNRKDFFVVSKLWNTYHRPDLVVKGCKKSLKNLGMDYMDLFLMHWPMAFEPTDRADKPDLDHHYESILECREFFPVDEKGELKNNDQDYIDTWKAMETCVDLGLVKSIGVSNFNSQQIDRLLQHARIKPVTNQVEVHPYMNQKKLIEFCKERDIIVTAYGPLGTQAAQSFITESPMLVDHPDIKAIAKELGKTPAQVILKYLTQLGTVPIPKTKNVSRLKENINIYDFCLNPEQMSKIDLLNCNKRFCIMPGTHTNKHYPFDIEF